MFLKQTKIKFLVLSVYFSNLCMSCDVILKVIIIFMTLLCITYYFISQSLCYVTSLTCTYYGVLGWPTTLIYIIQFYLNCETH